MTLVVVALCCTFRYSGLSKGLSAVPVGTIVSVRDTATMQVCAGQMMLKLIQGALQHD